MTCKRCGKEREIFVERRGLCRNCYQWARRNNQLNLFPKEKLSPKHRYLFRYPGLDVSLKRLSYDTSTTLESVAKQYGVSRERIRQIYQELFDTPYTNCLAEKTKIRKEIFRTKKRAKREQYRQNIYLRLITYNNGQAKRGTLIEWIVYQRCLDLGYDVKVGDTNTIDLLVNGLRVEVKSRNNAAIGSKTSKILYYKFNIRDKQSELADYFVLYVAPKNEFYIVPNDKKGICKSRLINIPEHETYTATSKHEMPKYLEAWYLLSNINNFKKNIPILVNNACNYTDTDISCF